MLTDTVSPIYDGRATRVEFVHIALNHAQRVPCNPDTNMCWWILRAFQFVDEPTSPWVVTKCVTAVCATHDSAWREASNTLLLTVVLYFSPPTRAARRSHLTTGDTVFFATMCNEPVCATG